MNDDRYITERITDKDGRLLMVRISMKVYKEWVDENGEPQVFHKTDTEGFKSTLVKEDYEGYILDSLTIRTFTYRPDESLYFTVSDMGHSESFKYPPDIRLTAKELIT